MSKPANHLEVVNHLLGAKLHDGWEVVEKTKREVTDTGGCFSVSYVVRHGTGRIGFLKVLNLAKALAMPGDQLENVQNLIAAFKFERDTLDLCKEYNLNRVASAIYHGKLDVDGNPFGVYYIIFEIAEDGDIRRKLAKAERVDIAWMLRNLHHTANGIRQMHSKQIAHQDL